MTITERLMSVGSWDITLSRETPYAIRSAIVPFSHVVILPAAIPTALSDAQMLSSAIYTGVVRRPGPQFQIGGPGLAMWLGDEDGGGPILTSAVTNTAGSLTTWVSGLLPAQLTAGTLTGAGTLTHSVQWMNRRTALDAVVRYFWQSEWRINPDFTFDVGTAANLYGSTPTVIASPLPATRDQGGVAGLGATIDIGIDLDDYASAVTLIGQSQTASSGGAGAYRDNTGSTFTWRRLIDAKQTPAGQESTAAAQYVTDLSAVRNEIRVATPDFAAIDLCPVGSTIYVWDPDLGLESTANTVLYQGQVLHPTTVRVVGATWPVQQGMGVWLRSTASGSAVWTDLTDWVEWETGVTTFECGSTQRPISAPSWQPPNVTAEQLASTWNTYTPTVTNFTTGNGSVSGRFRREGTSLHFWIRIVYGTTSSVTGAMTATLPSGNTSSAAGTQVVSMLAGVGGRFYHGLGLISAGATTVAPWTSTTGATYSSMTQLAAAVPAAWANGDSWAVEGTIEVQP